MKTIQSTGILVYYDGVQVFEGRDPIGGHYIGMVLERTPAYDRYLVTGVRPERLRQFRSSTVDLRTLFLEAPGGEWFLTLTNGDPGESLALEPQSGSLKETGFLPLDGYTLDDTPIDDLALSQARARHNVVFEFSVEPPEAARSHRVRMTTLGGLLLQMQSVVKHAYRSAVRDLSLQARNAIDTSDGHLMDVVVPAAPGSYRVILEAAKSPDMFGYGELARGLRRLDEVFATADDLDTAQESLRKHKGRLADSYIKLIKSLSANNTGLSYSWADPSLKTASYGGVTEADAHRLAAILSGVTSTTTGAVTIVGEFERVNRGRGDWGLLTSGGVTKTGNIRQGGPSLNGLQVGKRYRFHCVEDTELDFAGNEKQTLYLTDIENA